MNLIQFVSVIGTLFLGYYLSAMVIPRILLVSYRCRLFDQIDSRKLHRTPIPRLGGIAFFPCIFTVVSFVVIGHNLFTGTNLLDFEQTNWMFALLASLFMLYLTGLMDDLIGVRYGSKFIIQILCGIFLVASGIHFDSLYGLFGIYELPDWFSYPFTVFIVVYILNAVNLIDGIDGLASGLSIIAFSAFAYLFVSMGWWLIACICVAAIGVLIPFFQYNVFGNPRRGRKIFMGDTGSLTIGLFLAFFAIRFSMMNETKDATFPGAIVIAFSFLMVPMLDVVRVVMHRMRNGHPPFMPDKNHIHHKFIRLGFTQRKAMVTIVLIALAFAVVNVFAIYYISVTVLFILDVLVWTVMHIFLTRSIQKKEGPEK